MWAMMESLATIKATGQMPVGQLLLNYAADFKDDPGSLLSPPLLAAIDGIRQQIKKSGGSSGGCAPGRGNLGDYSYTLEYRTQSLIHGRPSLQRPQGR